jgi:hypothetical protein
VSKPKHKWWSVVRSPEKLMLRVPFRFVIGGFYPMTPRGCNIPWHEPTRWVWFGNWIKEIGGWQCYCWQVRLLWFAIGRCVPVQEALEYDE